MELCLPRCVKKMTPTCVSLSLPHTHRPSRRSLPQRATQGADRGTSRNSMLRDGGVRRTETKASGVIPRARPCPACGTVAMLVLAAGGAAAFEAIPPTPWTHHSSHAVSRAAVAQRSLRATRVPFPRYRWMLKRCETLIRVRVKCTRKLYS